MIKVLHVLRDLSRGGGVQRLVYDLALQPAADLQMDILITNREAGPEYIQELQARGVKVLKVSRWNIFHLWAIFRRYQVIHAHLFPALYLVGLLRKQQIYTEHNTTNNRRSIRGAWRLESLVYRRFRAVCCISPETRLALRQFLRCPAMDNTRLVFNGINLDTFKTHGSIENKRSESELIENERVKAESLEAAPLTIKLVMVGSLTPKKDQKTLIRALALLPCKYRLHLGGDGPCLAELQQMVDELGLSKRVVFHGLISDISAFLADKDLYVQSSCWEGFGLAAVEAMAAGLPVLCADVPGLNSLADSKELLFTQGDEQQLSELIRKCFQNRSYRKQLLAIAAATSKKFSIATTLSEYHDLYRDAARERA